MKIKRYIIWSLGALFLLVSCKKSELEKWSEKGRVWFAGTGDINFLFLSMSDNATESIVKIPLITAGAISSSDRQVKIEIVEEPRDLSSKYEVINPILIKADSVGGEMQVKLFRTANLKNSPDTLKFRVVSSTDLDPGIVDRQEIKLIFSDTYIQPKWWYVSQLGNYSTAKHRVIFEVFGNDNDLRGKGADPTVSRGWTSADALYNLYLLNKYCEDNQLSFRFQNGK